MKTPDDPQGPAPAPPAGGPFRPLTGVTVVALEHAVAAPFATRQLADLGARVIKIERPDGGDFARDYDHAVGGESSYFVWLNRAKESVAVNIKEPRGQQLLAALLARADVFVHNLAPGAVERLGLDHTSVSRLNPGIISCSISGYGRHGDWELRRAYDLLIQCETGLVSVTGSPAEAAKVGVSIADISAGMYAFSGVLAALIERRATGRGRLVEVAMLDSLGEWMSQPTYAAKYSGSNPPRRGLRHASIAPYGPYRTGDGSTIFLGVQNDREWARLCREVLRRPELVDDPRFARNVDRLASDSELTTIMEACLAEHSAEAALELLLAAGVACGRVRTPAEFADHPELRARGRWAPVTTPAGAMDALRPPLDASRGEGAPLGDVPGLGEHTTSVLHEFLGLTSDPPGAIMAGNGRTK